MRRTAPRPLGAALDEVARRAAPATTLARVQGCWASVAGEAVAGEAEPISERQGAVTLACSSASWAQELELLAPDLLERLNRALAVPDAPAPVRRLRFVTRR